MTAVGTSGDLTALFAGGALLIPLVAALAGAGWAARRLHRRYPGRGLPLWFAGCAAIAVILVATLLREAAGVAASLPGGALADWPGIQLRWSPDGWDRLSYDTFGSSQTLLNTVLFVPAGLLWTLLVRRALVTAAALAGLSLAIELLQGITALGVPDVADLVANSAGAVLGAILGAAALVVTALRAGERRRARRIGARLTLTLALLALAGWFLVGIGAKHRMDSLVAELTHRYAGTTLERYRDWERADQLSERVFYAGSVPTDGGRTGPGEAVVRFPASFFGVTQCAFVVWSPEGVEVRAVHGTTCTGLLR